MSFRPTVVFSLYVNFIWSTHLLLNGKLRSFPTSDYHLQIIYTFISVIFIPHYWHSRNFFLFVTLGKSLSKVLKVIPMICRYVLELRFGRDLHGEVGGRGGGTYFLPHTPTPDIFFQLIPPKRHWFLIDGPTGAYEA